MFLNQSSFQQVVLSFSPQGKRLFFAVFFVKQKEGFLQRFLKVYLPQILWEVVSRLVFPGDREAHQLKKFGNFGQPESQFHCS